MTQAKRVNDIIKKERKKFEEDVIGVAKLIANGRIIISLKDVENEYKEKLQKELNEVIDKRRAKSMSKNVIETSLQSLISAIQ